MNRFALIAFAFFISMAGLTGQASAGLEDSGVKALFKGDYKTALKELSGAAEMGNYGAMYYLGEMYRDGLGVARDNKKAAELYLKAAEGNYPNPQYRLGNFYKVGKGVAQDYKTAYMWYEIAVHYGDKRSVKKRDEVATKLTSSEISEAKKMAKDRQW